MIKRIHGAPKLFHMPKKASTDFNEGQLVYADGSGNVQPADATSGDHLGLNLRPVSSSDDDYADNTKLPIDFISPEDVLEADVPNDDLATGDVGNTCDLSSSGDGIDPDATSKNVVTIIGFVSSGKALIRVNSMITSKNVSTT